MGGIAVLGDESSENIQVRLVKIQPASAENLFPAGVVEAGMGELENDSLPCKRRKPNRPCSAKRLRWNFQSLRASLSDPPGKSGA